MFRNHLILAWRNLLRRKSYSLINIGGLAIGMAACLLILQYVSFEQSFDRFHEKADNIYRVINDRYQNGERVQIGAITYPTVGPKMKEDFPEVTNNTRVFFSGHNILKNDTELFVLHDCVFTEENFLDIFSYVLLAGDQNTALRDQNSIVLTESVAAKIFGAPTDYNSLIGKKLQLENDPTPFQVTGIIADAPENSFIQFEVLISYETLINAWGEAVATSWQWSDFYHYLELAPDADPKALEAKLEGFSKRYFKEGEVSGNIEKFYLQPITEAHLGSTNLEYIEGRTGNPTVVWSLLIVACLILIIAWVNYTNLSTVRAFERAQEVGVRKVLGASRSQLLRQFLAEALLFNIAGLAIAIILNEMTSPILEMVLGVNLSLSYLLGSLSGLSYLPWLILGAWLLGVFLSGVYPALVLSAHQAAKVLKGKFTHSKQGSTIRRALVTFQFAASIAFISGTIVAYQQIMYFHEKDLGIDLKETLVIRGPQLTQWDSTFIGRAEQFKQALTAFPEVKSVASSQRIPGDRLGRTFDLRRENRPEDKHTSGLFNVDHDFFKNFDVKVLAGRDFRPTDHHADWNALNKVVINASTVDLLQFDSPEQAVGQKVVLWDDRNWEVIGVVSDFHQESLKSPMEPIVFIPAYSNSSFFSLKIQEGSTDKVLGSVKETFLTFYPNNTFEHFFLDEHYNRQYKSDYSFGMVMGSFSFLAIIIACLGLFGLISYSVVLRTKEIGVRKVLGATVSNLVLLLTRETGWLIALGFLIAVPVTAYGIQRWLQGFAYRIDIAWWVFPLAGIAVLLLAALSVGYRSYQAAVANPADSLRSE